MGGPGSGVPNKKHSQLWNDHVKTDAVKTWLVLGNLHEVAKTIGVPYQTVRAWRMTDWWYEIEEALMHEDQFELSAKLRSRIHKTLDIVEDRLSNGDFMYDPRTGEFIRRPVSLRDANQAMSGMIKQKMELDALPKQQASAQAVLDTLGKLTEEFRKMAQGKKRPATDIEAIVPQLEDKEVPCQETTDANTTDTKENPAK